MRVGEEIRGKRGRHRERGVGGGRDKGEKGKT